MVARARGMAPVFASIQIRSCLKFFSTGRSPSRSLKHAVISKLFSATVALVATALFGRSLGAGEKSASAAPIRSARRCRSITTGSKRASSKLKASTLELTQIGAGPPANLAALIAGQIDVSSEPDDHRRRQRQPEEARRGDLHRDPIRRTSTYKMEQFVISRRACRPRRSPTSRASASRRALGPRGNVIMAKAVLKKAGLNSDGDYTLDQLRASRSM